MEYYLAVKRNEGLTPVSIQMNLGNTVLSERSQLIKEHPVYTCIYMTCPEQANPEPKSVLLVATGCGETGMGSDR